MIESASGRGLLAILLVVGMVSSLGARDLNTEIQLSNGSATGSDPRLIVGPADVAFIVFVEAGQVRFASRPHVNANTLAVTTGPEINSNPALQVGSSGLTTVIYERMGGADLDVFYTANPGGPFGVATPLAQTTADEGTPCLASSALMSDRNAVWVETTPGVGSTIRASFELGASVFVGDGDDVDCAEAENGELSIVYTRGGDLFFRSGAGTFGGELTVVADAAVESAPSIDVDALGASHIAFVRDGDVFYSQGDGVAPFSGAVNLSQSVGSSSEPWLRLSSAGLVHVLYLEDNDVWLVASNGAGFDAPVNLTQTPADPEESVSFGLDGLGDLHLTYRRAGEVFYRNSSEPPQSTFTADVQLGEFPLPVSFTDESTGVIETWLWDFGDGQSSTEQSPSHVYEDIGVYDVTLTTTGPGGSSVETQTQFIEVIQATQVMRIPDIPVFQGQTDVVIPILGTNPVPIQGFQVSMSWDCVALDVTDTTIVNSTTAFLQPEFLVVNIETCFMTVGCVYDSLPPLDGRVLLPGTDQRLLNLVVDIDSAAPTDQPTVLDLENGLGAPFPINNIFIIGGLSEAPALVDGNITILPFSLPLPVFFVRGDADRDTQVNVADAIYILGFLFSEGRDFLCPDSADVNDNGSTDIADAVSLLSFLFTNGAAPPYPFPSGGLDPTEDLLIDCL